MALNCPASVVFHTSPQQRAKARAAARTYKFGSPKIRDVLREKCRTRVKEARRASFDKARGSRDGEDEALIKRILREEVSQLEEVEDLKLQELIYKEMMEEANEWFIEECEQQESYFQAVESQEIVFCPICQKSSLHTKVHELACTCGESFSFMGSLGDFSEKIQKTMIEHERECDQDLMFFTEPWKDNRKKLNVLCQNCDYFCNF